MKRAVKLFVLALVLAVALTASGPGLAGPGGQGRGQGNEHGGDNGMGNGFKFKDVAEDFWGYHDILLMNLKDVLGGYGDGNFGPNDPVTRIQLVCLALRIMALDDDAMALTPEEAQAILDAAFADASSVPTWEGARECLAYALENGYLDEHFFTTNDGGLPSFGPNEAASRLEVVVTLLAAMGLAGEATQIEQEIAEGGFEPEAPDWDQVPEWAVGWVALAIEMDILRGDDDGCLDLGSEVTRAQIAALLARVDAEVDSDGDDFVIHGALTGIDPAVPSISVETTQGALNQYREHEREREEGQDEGDDEGDEDEDEEEEEDEDEDDDTPVTVTLTVSAAAQIFLRGTPATLDDLAVGDKVQVLAVDGVAYIISAKCEREEVKGVLLESAYDEETGLLSSLTVEVLDEDKDEDEDEDEEEGEEGDQAEQEGAGDGGDEGDDNGSGYAPGAVVTFEVSPDVAVWFRGDHDSDVQPAAGDILELKLVHDVVVIIVIDERYELKGELEGVLVAVNDDGTITVTVTEIDWEEGDVPSDIVEGEDVVLTLDDEVDIRWRGETVTAVDLVAGSELELKMEDGLVTKIRVESDDADDADD
ncbi:MAG: S-layer homology domain-containing protein, partial [Bacillota bacterium]